MVSSMCFSSIKNRGIAAAILTRRAALKRDTSGVIHPS